ncbi:lipoate--protein ligase family protein [Agromyces binzhouensis]|uniref:Lipoate--protein ligase family protein n=1 Tax=Agromyces binzhouensis TaxID=1817495 RepID=A0A4Q2JWQ4_9MICO|nr:lipoate--protein ligase family protein [Agromyces binzhouensis]RXZ51666.1 lipoate--protein ligase family protein [Agromyces binzhouensis]
MNSIDAPASLILDAAPRPGGAAFEDSLRLLHAVAASALRGPLVRVYRPLPTVAFSRREANLPAFAEAESAARSRGFEPAIRPAGGRAVAYDPTCIVVDLITAEPLGRLDHRAAFIDAGTAFVQALREVGVEAALGPVPREYCPGEHSVNARGAVKLVGTAQRRVRGARLLSAALPLGAVDALREVLVDVNAALSFDWDPETLGSVASERPGVDEDALIASIARHLVGPTRRLELDEALIAAASAAS